MSIGEAYPRRFAIDQEVIAVSEERPVHRRRRQALEQAAVPQQEPRQERRPLRIVAGEEEQPDWLVSAGDISGAASRRAGRMEEKGKTTAQKPAATKAAAPKAAAAKAAAPKAAAPKPATDRPVQKSSARTSSAAKPAGSKPVAKKKTAASAVGGFTAQGSGRPRTSGAKSAKPATKLSKKGRERRNRQIRRVAGSVLAVALLATLMVVAVVGGGRLVDIKRTLDKGDSVFYPNIFVNDIPLEGRTLDEAASVVTQQVVSLISSWKITLRTPSGQLWEITGADLNMQYDVADQLDQLWAIGHTGSSSTRYEQVKALEEQAVMRYTTLTYDLTRVTQILTQIKAEVDRPAVSATRVSDDTKWPPFSYTDDVPGLELDITGLNEQICGMVNRLESGVVDLTPTPVQANVTREYLQGQIVQLGSFDTTVGLTSDPGRFTNIEVGTSKFNHLIIKAGETVSFNKVAGKRIYANGYVDAPEIAYGSYVIGVGGGICQVSSTLYNAVINAGLEVVTRTQHSLASNYVEKGQDATVQDGRLDFVFRNNTGADIYIETEYYKKGNYPHCKFVIYGRPDPNGYSYKLVSQTVEEIPIPDPTYRPDTEAQYVVYDDEEKQTSNGEKGYVVDVYLVTMDKNGLEVSRTLDHTDTYKATTPVIYVGVTPRETPSPFVY